MANHLAINWMRCFCAKSDGHEQVSRRPPPTRPRPHILVDECGPELKTLFLENVQNILNMPNVWKPVLNELYMRGFDASWCTLTAAQCGLAQQRARWFLLAQRFDAPTPQQFAVCLNSEFLQECAVPKIPLLPPVNQWLLPLTEYPKGLAPVKLYIRTGSCLD